jgi:hypothetical protein
MKQLLFILLILLSFQGFSQNVKFGKLEIMEYNLGEMTWDEAKKACEELGDGWRLPTKEEFKTTIYPNLSKIPNLEDAFYWCSNEYNVSFIAWYFYCGTSGSASGLAFLNLKDNDYYVRLVRDLK